MVMTMALSKQSRISDTGISNIIDPKGLLINGLFFNSIWFSTVVFNAFTVSIVLGMVWLQVNFKILFFWRYIAISAVIGLLFDTLLTQVGWLNFSNAGQSHYSLVLLWLAFSFFSVTFLTFAKLNIILLSILSASMGPLSYFAAMNFGAVNIDWNNSLFTSVFFLFWFLALPLMNLLFHHEKFRIEAQK